MPVHDWTRVEAGIFHAFHQGWITELSRALNQGLLPDGYYALPEQVSGEFGPDVLTLQSPGAASARAEGTDGGAVVALEADPPKVRLRMQSEARQYAAKADTVVIRHISGHHIVAMLEIVSPGNKSSRSAMNAFVRKAREALAAGIHLLIVDLFPPGPRDPEGIHRAVWGEDCGEDYAVPADQPLTCVSYLAGARAEAFVEFVAVGDPLPPMPLCLTSELYVKTPLEPTYAAAFAGMAKYWRDVIEASDNTR